MGSALKINDIAEKKKSLGYSENTDYLAYVQVSKKLEYLIGTFTSSLINKMYVISFEEDGLLFMGINLANQFTNSDKFIPLSEIGSISYKSSKLINGRLVFNAEKLIINSKDGKTSEHLMYTMVAIASWIKKDLPNVHARIDSYPSLKESFSAKEESSVVTDTNSAADANMNKLRELKALLDEGVITQSEFDEKKRDILSEL